MTNNTDVNSGTGIALSVIQLHGESSEQDISVINEQTNK